MTSSPLTVQLCEQIIERELGATPKSPLETREFVDQAGHHLVSMHSWKWLEGRMARLRSRVVISTTGATWTEATRTLTQTGLFADYDFLSGDVFQLTSGTGATVAYYEIESRTSDDAIVLARSIGSAADGQTDIIGVMPNDQVELPSDFDLQRITAYAASNGLVAALSMRGTQTFLDSRVTNVGMQTFSFWAIFNYVHASTTDGRLIPRMEHWPSSGDGTEQFTIFYRAGWATPEDDGTPLPLPMSGWLNALYIEILKAFAVGTEEKDIAPISTRLALIEAGPVFRVARERDSILMPSLGALQNGWLMDPEAGYVSRFNRGQNVAPMP